MSTGTLAGCAPEERALMLESRFTRLQALTV
jgi:hypothetical protein